LQGLLEKFEMTADWIDSNKQQIQVGWSVECVLLHFKYK